MLAHYSGYQQLGQHPESIQKLVLMELLKPAFQLDVPAKLHNRILQSETKTSGDIANIQIGLARMLLITRMFKNVVYLNLFRTPI